MGAGPNGRKITYGDAWRIYEKSMHTNRIPSTTIDRYPVVARWRNDVDYVAAGIYCFQPYCVTGEMDPPANPLISAQFSVRFNDLDNIGLTGRHYSGFVMVGNHVFNYPDKFVYFTEGVVEFNHRYLTEGFEIPPVEITFIEDVWAGGGNLGPSMEYFVRGLEVGNMVFMQFKTFHDGSFEELPIKVIDVGIGLERLPWLINGSATSYVDVFATAYKYLTELLKIEMNNEIWTKIGPYTCRLDVDEAEDLGKVWQEISDLIEVPVEAVKEAIGPLRDIFIILDHTRSALVTICDGSLPSNIGGGSNLRNIIRRTFAVMKKNGWWEQMTFDQFMQIFEHHKIDLAELYGPQAEYKSFEDIIKMEYERWTNTDEVQKKKLEALIKKKKTLDLDDWIVIMTSWGIPADTIAQISKQAVPLNLYYTIASQQEKMVKAAEQVLYSTTHLPETKNLYYDNHKLYDFEAEIVDLFLNVTQKQSKNIVCLSQSAFYPTSGGQQHDTGKITIEGEEYNVVNVEKVGKVILHILDRPVVKDNSELIGLTVQCSLDEERRDQLRCHHTATHVMFSACKQVLGPHVWQNGAKKTIHQAHLDITHYSSITKEQEQEIQNTANKMIMKGIEIHKSLMSKTDAEKDYGFSLYQGGVVPGNELRVVNIEGHDVEACCGTHCDNTNEIGWIKLLTTKRIADGIVRLYYVAAERTLEILNKETNIINDLTSMWGIEQKQIVMTAARFFKESKTLKSALSSEQKKMMNLQIRYLCNVPQIKLGYAISEEDNPTMYFSFLNPHAGAIKVKNLLPKIATGCRQRHCLLEQKIHLWDFGQQG
jgi:alanyl-tRNA synthetase